MEQDNVASDDSDSNDDEQNEESTDKGVDRNATDENFSSNFATLYDDDLRCANLTIDDDVSFYAALNFKYTDFSNELSALNPCIVSGDGLLLEIICYKYLNWHFGGQTLPIVYLFEQFLNMIQSHGGCTKVVWFKELETLFCKNSKINIMYHSLKKHCQIRLDSLEVISPVCNEWLKFLSDTRPPFIVALSETVNMEAFYEDSISKKFKTGFACLIYSSLKNGVAVATVCGLRKSLSIIEGFYVKSLPMPPLAVFDSLFMNLWKSSVQIKCADLKKVDYNTLEDFWYTVLNKLKAVHCLNDAKDFEKSSQIFLFYLIILKRMPLSVRCCSTTDELAANWMTDTFVPGLLKTASDLISFANLTFCTADMYDGNLLHNICCNFEKQNLMSLFAVDGECFSDYKQLCEKVGMPFLATAKAVDEVHIVAEHSQVQNMSISKIFQENRLLELYFKGNDQYFDSVVRSMESAFPRFDFFEKYHWHSGRLFSDDVGDKIHNKSGPPIPQWKLDRQNQKMRAWLRFYGESLEGLETMFSLASRIIVGGVTKPDEVSAAEEVKQGKHQWKPKEKGAKKCEKQTQHSKALAEEIRLKKRAKDVQDEFKNIETQLEKVSQSIPLNVSDLLVFQKMFEHAKFDENKAAILKKEMKSLVQTVGIQTYKDMNTKQQGAFLLIENIKQLVKKYSQLLLDKDQAFINEIFRALGFSKLFSVAASTSLTSSIKERLSLEIEFINYQLKFCGQLLEIQADPQVDRRIRFIPDSWQVELLNIVDAWQSALIVAPTSAGKTFISYYCIEKVFRETTDGIVVYVSPTKALVTQVAATIYARFKAFNMKPGQAVFGVFTRDYCYDVHNSRVLVTDPQCLEILLLSPDPDHCEWRKKIRYVIFDEIHCIGGGIGDVRGSEIWEHIILMVQSPFLALSATVANPFSLLNWLKSAENFKMGRDKCNKVSRNGGAKSYSVKLIQFSERFSELEMYIYDHKKKALENLHPFSTLHLNSVAKYGFPSDMQLTALQVYHLFSAMSELDNEVDKPPDFFKSSTVWLKRSDLRAYEDVLKKRFITWVKVDIKKAEKVLELLAGENKNSIFMERTLKSFSVTQLEENMMSLMSDLNQKEMLPCLVFSDNRSLCEKLADNISTELLLKESEFVNRPENIKRWNAYLKDDEKYEQLKKKIRDNKDKDKRKNGTLIDDEKADVEEPSPPPFPFSLAVFSLRPPTANTAIYDKAVKRLLGKSGNSKLAQSFVEYLKRGVGIHHSGLSTAQKQTVEILFRAGLLGVVFSTSTLALGINMPCRSVVFCDDSMYLTPLQFRQMSGRAGRRGFDKKGSIIFYGIPPQKIVRLVCSSLPTLKGNIPFGVSFILQLLVLTNKTKPTGISVDSLVDQCLVCLNNPLYAENLEATEKGNFLKQLRYFVIFCIHALQFLNLIDNSGVPIGLAGVASYLHYQEPGNFIFVYFLQRGLFHSLCKRYSGEELDKQMLIVLCTIFTQKVLPYGFKIGNFANSKVILEKLPEPFETAMMEYNEKVEVLFGKVVEASCSGQNVEQYQLPASKVDLSRAESIESKMIGKKLESSVSSIQNPVAAISGFKDSDISFLNSQVFSPVNVKLYFDQSFLPSKPYPLRDHRGHVVNLNAYASDFFWHGVPVDLIRDNGLLENDVFNLLKDFLLTLSAICTALNMLADLNDPVVIAFANLLNKYKVVFKKAYGDIRFSNA